jgi:broad specificity phosphatase PhoE
MTMTLLMARHGQTDLNIDDRWQGRLDPPLNAAGLAQAGELAALLPADIEVLVCSPLLRARQTAAAVAQARGLGLQIEPAFRERDFGIFEGLTPEEARQRHPELWNPDVVFQWDDAPPGGETTRAVVQRVDAGLQALCRQHAGRRVLLVSHGFVVRCLRYLLDGLGEAEFFTAARIPNGSFLTRQCP